MGTVYTSGMRTSCDLRRVEDSSVSQEGEAIEPRERYILQPAVRQHFIEYTAEFLGRVRQSI
jgi:hypothetical protein